MPDVQELLRIAATRRRRRGSTRIVVSDTFTRADNASSLGTADTGQVWTAISGTWGIIANQAYSAVAGAPVGAVVDAGVADCTVRCRLSTIGAGSPGLYLRATDANNYWRLFRSSGTVLALQKRVAGSATSVGPLPSYTGQDGDVWTVVMSGLSIKCYINGTLMIDVADAAFASATKHGIGAATASTDARWDDFRVTS